MILIRSNQTGFPCGKIQHPQPLRSQVLGVIRQGEHHLVVAHVTLGLLRSAKWLLSQVGDSLSVWGPDKGCNTRFVMRQLKHVSTDGIDGKDLIPRASARGQERYSTTLGVPGRTRICAG